MPITPKCEAMPITRMGRVFTMKLPVDATIIRAGIAPDAAGAQSLWYTMAVGDTETGERHFIAVMDDGPVPDNSEHRGMWWEGAYTFHLFELIEDD